VKRVLRTALPSRAHLVAPHLFKSSFAEFVTALCHAGGVIEACPNTVTAAPAADLIIEPVSCSNPFALFQYALEKYNLCCSLT
jgi:hypothetical protein